MDRLRAADARATIAHQAVGYLNDNQLPARVLGVDSSVYVFAQDTRRAAKVLRDAFDVTLQGGESYMGEVGGVTLVVAPDKGNSLEPQPWMRNQYIANLDVPTVEELD